MILDRMYPYSSSVKYGSDAPLIMDEVKNFLNIFVRNGYNDNEVTKFYNQLLLLSKSFGLGDSISVETVHEEFTPEYIFTIQIPKHFSKNEKNDIFRKLNFQIERFCKSNNMVNFLKDAYIIFE